MEGLRTHTLAYLWQAAQWRCHVPTDTVDDANRAPQCTHCAGHGNLLLFPLPWRRGGVCVSVPDPSSLGVWAAEAAGGGGPLWVPGFASDAGA